MTVWVVVWVVLMMFWLFFGCYTSGGGPGNLAPLGNTLIPWLCVLILGLIMFGAIQGGAIR